ncbi:hypothetical protein Taro_042524 [Colocasia esculenta]|uniref:Uncharacterized protein n=1 Tax=Colocasia esculenta TaxID=4460 RepID=A0A843WT30_COLES|nr:hypothetical protein [Colocasia esculenta]
MGAHGDGPLFETTAVKGRLAYKLFAGSVFLGVCLIWVYRTTHVPGEGRRRWSWLGLLAADVWFGLYWVLTQSVRWNPTHRRSFPDRLSRRYKEEELPGADVFVCTADPTIEPPVMVVNTVLSVMAYDYPAKKLAVYLSDDGGSDLTFYALLEASRFARVWIPFCNRLQLEPRSPAAYFREVPAPPRGSGCVPDEWWAVQFSKCPALVEGRALIKDTYSLTLKKRMEDSLILSFGDWLKVTGPELSPRGSTTAIPTTPAHRRNPNNLP